MTLGLIGIIIGFCIILFLTFKNVNTIILAPIACVVVAIFNQLNPVEAFTDTYVSGMMSVLGMLLPIILLGPILGKVYTQTGAAESLADGFIKAFVDRAQGENKVRVAVAIIVVLSVLLCLGGIDGFIVLYTTFPIVVRVWKRLNMPRKYIPGMLMCATAASVCPGAPCCTECHSNVYFAYIVNSRSYSRYRCNFNYRSWSLGDNFCSMY